MSALTSISDLIPQVLIRCPNAGDAAALFWLRDTLKKFLNQTGIWRETGTITTVEDQATYDLIVVVNDVQTQPVAGAQIQRIMRVTPLNDDGDELIDIPADYYELDLETSEITFTAPYIPTVTGDTYNVTMILRPEWNLANASYPDWIAERWGDGLAAGAAASLMITPPYNKTASPILLDACRRVFNGALSDAKGEVFRVGTARDTGFTPV